MKIKETYLEQIHNVNQFADNTIPKKWCFNDRELESAVVPKDVWRIEDWAFSHCRQLTEVWLPKELETVGQGVFEGCEKLRRLVVYELAPEKGMENDIETVYESEAKLLALALHFAPRKELFDFAKLGTAEWYEWYDGRLLQFLETSDEQGFDPFLAGGEEDYEDPSNNIEYYCSVRQREKCRIILERLRNGKFLEMQLNVSNENSSGMDAIRRTTKELYEDYLSAHESAVIALFLALREQAYSYLKLCGDLRLITKPLADRLFDELTEGCFTECRAYLLYYKESLLNERDSEAGREIWDRFKIQM